MPRLCEILPLVGFFLLSCGGQTDGLLDDQGNKGEDQGEAGASEVGGGADESTEDGGNMGGDGDPTGQSGGDGGDEHDSGSETDTGSGGDGADDDPCEAVLCDPGRNDCPDGQKCSAWQCGDGCCTNSAGCFDMIGNQQEGELCTAEPGQKIDECGPTLWCRSKAGVGHVGVCMQFCQAERGGHGNCDELGLPGQHCFAFNRGTFPVCMRSCDPLKNDCEDGREGCFFAVDNFFCTGPVGPMGSGGEPAREGEDCWVEHGCEPGLICTDPDPAKRQRCTSGLSEGNPCTCMRSCDASRPENSGCGADWPKCMPLFEPGDVLEELLVVGICVE